MRVLGSVVVNGLKWTDWGVKEKGMKIEKETGFFWIVLKRYPLVRKHEYSFSDIREKEEIKSMMKLRYF